MFFIHKYAPKTDDDAIFNKPELKKLDIMSKDPSMPNVIFYGPEGSGVKTTTHRLLVKMFGESVDQLYMVPYDIENSSNNKKTIEMEQSDHHIVIEPKNNNFDRYLIQDVIKKYMTRRAVNSDAEKSFKVILINNVDEMSYYAQTSLRRTMEKYSGICRFVMWCRTLSKVIEPLKSRCHLFRIRSPPRENLVRMIFDVCAHERMRISFDMIKTIMDKSNRNIRNVLWNLQMLKYNESENLKTNYDDAIHILVENLMTGNQRYIPVNRIIIYDLFITKFTGSQIIKDCINKLLLKPDLSDRCKLNIVYLGSVFEHHFIIGRRGVMHLDAFMINTTAQIYDDE